MVLWRPTSHYDKIATTTICMHVYYVAIPPHDRGTKRSEDLLETQDEVCVWVSGLPCGVIMLQPRVALPPTLLPLGFLLGAGVRAFEPIANRHGDRVGCKCMSISVVRLGQRKSCKCMSICLACPW